MYTKNNSDVGCALGCCCAVVLFFACLVFFVIGFTVNIFSESSLDTVDELIAPAETETSPTIDEDELSKKCNQFITNYISNSMKYQNAEGVVTAPKYYPDKNLCTAVIKTDYNPVFSQVAAMVNPDLEVYEMRVETQNISEIKTLENIVNWYAAALLLMDNSLQTKEAYDIVLSMLSGESEPYIDGSIIAQPFVNFDERTISFLVKDTEKERIK